MESVPPVERDIKQDINRQKVPIKNATAMQRKNNSVFLVYTVQKFQATKNTHSPPIILGKTIIFTKFKFQNEI